MDLELTLVSGTGAPREQFPWGSPRDVFPTHDSLLQTFAISSPLGPQYLNSSSPEPITNIKTKLVVSVVHQIKQLKYISSVLGDLRRVLIGLVFAAVVPAVFTLRLYNSTIFYDNFLACIISAAICMSQICIWFTFRLKLRKREMTDQLLFTSTSFIIFSPYGLVYIRQAVIFLMHCPPGLYRVWPPLIYLNCFVILFTFG